MGDMFDGKKYFYLVFALPERQEEQALES